MEGGDDRDVQPEDVVKDEGSQTGVQPPKDTGNANITPPAGSPRNPITQPGASQQTPWILSGWCNISSGSEDVESWQVASDCC